MMQKEKPRLVGDAARNNLPRNSSLAQAAQTYAALGLYIFPVHSIRPNGACACSMGAKCSTPGKHPRISAWQRESTWDPSIVRAWWDQWPDSNIALHTGKSGLAVIDIDPRNGGNETFAALERKHGGIRAEAETFTGGGGRHLFFEALEGVSLPAALGQGVDLQRGDKYVILPPSNHKSGKAYEWRPNFDLPLNVSMLTTLPGWCAKGPLLTVVGRSAAGDDWVQEVYSESESSEWDDEVEHVFAALEYPPLDRREEYIMALSVIKEHSRDDPEAKERLIELLMDRPKWNADHFERDWASLSDRMKPGHLGLGTLYKLAKEHGWPGKPILKPASLDMDGPDTLGDLSNGRRLAKSYRGRLLHCSATETWHFWDGLRWALCEGGEALRAAKTVADGILRETGAAFAKDPSDAKKRAHQLALGVHRSKGRIEAMLDMASSEPGMSIANPGLFDKDAMLLGVRNGVVNLRTGTLLEAAPQMLISKQAGAAYDAHAKCPMWLEFLDNVFRGDGNMVEFIQRALGYSLTGLVDEEVAFFMHGQGANGKSVFANILRAVFGEYGLTAGAQLLVRRPNSSEGERHKAMLPGARMVLINEVGVNDVWDDQLFKELASREQLSARPLYAAPFEFMPTHALWIRGNHQPGVLDAGDAMWRRMVLIPFERQFASDERIPNLDRKILDVERDGILAWLVAGCLAWHRRGLRIPARIAAATEAYRKETDIMGDWVEELCRLGAGLSMGSTEGFASYRDFLVERGHKATGTVNTFSRQLVARRGITRGRTSKGKRFLGIELRGPEDFADEWDDEL
jgi:P4 family phage/plasmid primase-like protien